jgi:hypothetical protein
MYHYDLGAPVRWIEFVNHFTSLRNLTIGYNESPREWQSAIHSTRNGLQQEFISQLSLPSLRYISWFRMTLQLQDFSLLYTNFPNLRELHVVNVVMEAAETEVLTHNSRKRLALWYKAAMDIRDAYSGKCVLTFGGSIFQTQGYFCGEWSNYSLEECPAVTWVLKPPVLAVLSAISRSSTSDHADLDARYRELVKHECPHVLVDADDIDGRIEDEMDYEPRFEVVDTAGVTVVYYEVLNEDSYEH